MDYISYVVFFIPMMYLFYGWEFVSHIPLLATNSSLDL